jgi:hypothetical protein
MKKYKVELTERQLATLSSAAELVARLGIGQYRDAFNWLPIQSDISWSDYHADVDAIGDIISKYTSSDLGVSNPDTSSTSKIAWDLYQSFRRELAWDRAVDDGIIESRNSPRDWSKMMGVNYDEPYNTSGEPLAIVEKAEESDKEL